MSEKYFVVSNSEKKILENEVDLILFIDSWTEKNSKDHFAASESEEVIYIYELKEVHRRKKDNACEAGVKEVWI